MFIFRVPPFPSPTEIAPLSRLRHGSNFGMSGASGGSLPASPSASSGSSLQHHPGSRLEKFPYL